MKHVCYFVAVFIAWYIVGCASTGAGADRFVLDHQRQVTELEARNQDLERRLAAYDSAVGHAVEGLTELRERSTGMEGQVDEIISLFGEYQRRVEQLARDYNTINNQAKDVDANSVDTGGSPGG